MNTEDIKFEMAHKNLPVKNIEPMIGKNTPTNKASQITALNQPNNFVILRPVTMNYLAHCD